MAEPATQGPDASPPRTAGALGTEVSHPRPDAALLAVTGELDTLTAPELDTALRELVAGPHPLLVVDLTGVTFLASSGLAALIQAAHRAEDSDRALHLVVTARAVRRPIEITGSEQLFTLHSDITTALRG
ncbi:STAS domain-containing protein [Pseudonocardia lacus]|uniref:STAS domain-containing protein n=1 Tax=Pseudonocardia lacus TaxID=2835865 RepID=UPI001BDD4E54|nr:STAS domain-containing protein [Pseudonocardia lacus]